MIQSVAISASVAAPNYHRFRSAVGEHVLVVPHTRVYDLADVEARRWDSDRHIVEGLANALGLSRLGEADLDTLVEPSPQSLSLNVSSSCNLGCSYCYAGRGSFRGAQPAPMTWEIAQGAIDRLLQGADRAAPVTIGFLGGEPFVNSRLIHQATTYAASQGEALGFDVRFSVTTNGTLLSDADIGLLRRHPFAVTVSIDGGARIQDQRRPVVGGPGRSSFALLSRATAPLLSDPGRAKLAARVTATRDDLDLRQRFSDIIALGFPEVGFSPLRSAPAGGGALQSEDWPNYLSALVALAGDELSRVRDGAGVRLTNFAIALKQLHRGAAAPYPCGAGGGYFSVSSDGVWYACHRAIGNPTYRLGDNDGLDHGKRTVFLAERHVHAQTDCQTCWARYLCSGGCHQEAHARSEPSCDFVRGWLEFCLQAYCELSENHPAYFATNFTERELYGRP